jgi:hypothetical protein
VDWAGLVVAPAVLGVGSLLQQAYAVDLEAGLRWQQGQAMGWSVNISTATAFRETYKHTSGAGSSFISISVGAVVVPLTAGSGCGASMGVVGRSAMVTAG